MRAEEPNDINEFSLASYSRLIMQAKVERSFISYEQAPNAKWPDLIWRHDVDFSLRCAADVAEVDAEHEIQSIFFINISSDTYNARSLTGKGLVNRILEAGHSIGIHFDHGFYGLTPSVEVLFERLTHEANEFEGSFGVRPDVFSFHNPDSSTKEFQDEYIGNFINFYSSIFQSEWDYCSDSNGYWRHSPISQVLSSSSQKPLQVLTHPEWWTRGDFKPRERLSLQFFLDAFMYLEDYDEFLRRQGRQNLSVFDLKTNTTRDVTRRAMLRFLFEDS
jgi:hypothetical protein